MPFHHDTTFVKQNANDAGVDYRTNELGEIRARRYTSVLFNNITVRKHQLSVDKLISDIIPDSLKLSGLLLSKIDDLIVVSDLCEIDKSFKEVERLFDHPSFNRCVK